MLIVSNWPSAVVLFAFIIGASVVVDALVNRDKPISRHCAKCQKIIKDQAFYEQYGINRNPDE